MKTRTLSPIFRSLLLSFTTAALLAGAGCRAIGGAEGDTPSQQRTTITDEAASTLDQLYSANPATREKVRKGAGYAYFSNVNVHVLLVSSENGYGVVHNNYTGKDTYMKMAGAGAGFGMGVKDYRVVFIFTDKDVMRRFIDSGWDFGASADAAAKTGKTGGAADAAVSASSVAGMEIYQITKDGLALQATAQGTKYWRDDKLN